ncbi:protein ERGIC-53-like [Pseudophryne corroboree]|uniref:protein ERGIC-53-like n=1 Tax=Pseudophryne corroboree TaxID=495146 RepID=UPI00308203EA
MGALSCKSPYLVFYMDRTELRTRQQVLPKVVFAFHLNQPIVIPSSFGASNPPEALKIYIRRTARIRKTDSLFVFSDAQKGCPSKQAIARWIRLTIQQAYVSAALPVPKSLKARSIRSRSLMQFVVLMLPSQSKDEVTLNIFSLWEAQRLKSNQHCITMYQVTQVDRKGVPERMSKKKRITPNAVGLQANFSGSEHSFIKKHQELFDLALNMKYKDIGVALKQDVRYGRKDLPAHRRFEYKYSFKGPHVTLPDGTLPFWEIYGGAIASPDEVRLVPSLKNHNGAMWTKYNASFPHWEVELSIRISGHGRQGAEGLALWYTREPGGLGPVYGAADRWDGVAIIFDTFDHDFKGNNPAIVIVGNNGKLEYDHLRDGSSQALGTCVENFRNTIRPFRVKISFYKRTLRVSASTGYSPSDRAFTLCAEVRNMVIPSTGYFGISAATSALADDHDVLSFMLYSLSATWQESPAAQIPTDEKEMFEKEYEEFQRELEKNMQNFQKNNSAPDEDAFESDNQRELEMVLFGQTRLLEELSVLKHRLNMTVEEQRRHRDILSHNGVNETTTVNKEHVHSSLETVMNGMPDLLAMTKELKKDILSIAKDLSSSKGGANASPAPSSTDDVKEDFSKIRRSLQSLVKSSVSTQTSPCPSSLDHSFCLSSGIFLTFLLVQSVCTVVYMLFRTQRHSGSKKLF